MRWIAAAGVATSLVGPAAWAAPGKAPIGPTETTPPRRGPALVVEVDPGTLDADALRARVLDEATRALAERPDPLAPEDEIRVRLEGQTFAYRLTLELRRHGAPLLEQPEPSTCECSSSELLHEVVAAVDEGAQQLEQAARAEANVRVTPTSEGDAIPPVEPGEPMPRVRAPTRRSDRLWLSGVVLTSIGGATTIAGVTMAVVGPQPLDGATHAKRHWQTLGYPLLGIGAATLVGGVTMLVIDVVRCRRRGRCHGAVTRPR